MKVMQQGQLAGKVAIVTGAASIAPGIGNGAATAILFACDAAKVLLVNWSEGHAMVEKFDAKLPLTIWLAEEVKL